MEYQKITNLLDYASNQPSKFRTKNLFEINDESRGTYPVTNQIKFKTMSSLCDCSDVYILKTNKTTIEEAKASQEHLITT